MWRCGCSNRGGARYPAYVFGRFSGGLQCGAAAVRTAGEHRILQMFLGVPVVACNVALRLFELRVGTRFCAIP